MFEKAFKFVKHNFGICLGLFLAPFVLWYGFSCQSQVVSVMSPNRLVTRGELIAEVDAFLSLAEARFSDLDRQDLVRNTIFNSLSDLIKNNPTSPAGIALFVTNLLGVGAVLDNVRKRTLISTLKNRSDVTVTSTDSGVSNDQTKISNQKPEIPQT